MRTGTNPFNQSYSYDANNNRTSITSGGVQTLASYDAANQLISFGSSSYGYDADGNLTSYDGNSLSYDAANHWTSGTVNGHTLSFGYDGQGRRVAKTVDGSRTDQWYDTTGMALETGAQSATYLLSPHGKPLSITSGSTHSYYVRDRLGSITGLLATDGSLSGSYTYDPWGNPVAAPASGYNPERYAGAQLDDSTGIYLMGARYYLPTVGRFSQLDPSDAMRFTGNRYFYADDNPVNSLDPTGLYTIIERYYSHEEIVNGWYGAYMAVAAGAPGAEQIFQFYEKLKLFDDAYGDVGVVHKISVDSDFPFYHDELLPPDIPPSPDSEDDDEW